MVYSQLPLELPSPPHDETSSLLSPPPLVVLCFVVVLVMPPVPVLHSVGFLLTHELNYAPHELILVPELAHFVLVAVVLLAVVLVLLVV